MPELPEVETTRRGIAPHVTGRRVARIDVYDSRLRWPVPADLDARMRGRTIDRVDRRSTYLPFHAGESALLAHLVMTGALRVFREPPPRRTTRSRRAAIKLALMDNRVVTGVGNIYSQRSVVSRRHPPRSSFFCPNCQRR